MSIWFTTLTFTKPNDVFNPFADLAGAFNTILSNPYQITMIRNDNHGSSNG